MTFSLLKRLSGRQYEAFDRPSKQDRKSNATSRSGSPAGETPQSASPTGSSEPVDTRVDTIEDRISDSHKSSTTRHERTLSDETVTSQSVTEQWAEVLAPTRLQPRRKAPGIPETMETHLQRLGPDAGAQRAEIADAMLAHAAREWSKDLPAPLTIERMTFQPPRLVCLQKDVAGSAAFILLKSLTPNEAAKHFWLQAVESVLEVYITPRPEAHESSRSVYYPQARATIAHENPELHTKLTAIETAAHSQLEWKFLGSLLLQLNPPKFSR